VTIVAEIEQRLQVLAPEQIEVTDDSAKHRGHEGAKAGGGHFQLRIVASCFSGLTALSRHRLVYDALGSMMRREIHAISIDASAPESPNNPTLYQENK
jgi:BolA protein